MSAAPDPADPDYRAFVTLLANCNDVARRHAMPPLSKDEELSLWQQAKKAWRKTLDQHLAACQRESGLREHVTTAAHRALQRAAADEPDLAAEIRRRLAAIHPDVLLRDHVSRWLAATLTGALPKDT